MNAIVMKDLTERQPSEVTNRVNLDKPVDPSERHGGIDDVGEMAAREPRGTIDATSPYR